MSSLTLSQITRILFVDPSIQNTGYSVWYVNNVTKEKIVRQYGNIITPKQMDDIGRIDYVIEKLQRLVSSCRTSCICIEEPPATVYGWPKLQKKVLVGKSTKLFKLAGLFYSLQAYPFAVKNKPCRKSRILPVEWQSKLKKATAKYKTMKIKDRSLHYVNTRFPLEKPMTCHNTADAICMGDIMIPIYGGWQK